jgi:uncharacterized RDD family membrane protein YckC
MSEKEKPESSSDQPTIPIEPKRPPPNADEAPATIDLPALHTDSVGPASSDSIANLGESDTLVQPQDGEKHLAHYRLQAEIGRGGMGTVYRALDTLLDRQVAVKVLADRLSTNSELRDRFVREARIIARISHPNLPHIHFVGRSKGRLFFAMEWVDGESLEALLAREPVTEVRALGIIRQVAIGLQEAHAAGIVHRDIKPSNIMMTRDCVVKILDFGIARSAAFDAGATATGAFLGTPHYASPEQARGEKADHRSDIYSAGEVLFALLTGRPPFDGSNPMTVLTDRLVKPVPEIPPETACSEEVRKLVRRMMAKDPADRQQSCEALQHEIEAAAPGELVPASSSKRSWAGLTDALLIGLPFAAAWVVFQAITGYFPTTLLYDSGLGRVLLGLILLGWPLAYSALLTDREGRTVGQRLQGIRTTTQDSETPSRRRLAFRAMAIWGPIALGMSVQTDWPLAAVDAGRLGALALVAHNVPFWLVQFWVLTLVAIPFLNRKRRHIADMISRTRVQEIRRPWQASSAGTGQPDWSAVTQRSRRAFSSVAVLLTWIGLTIFFLLQVNGLPDIRETVAEDQPGWNRLLDRFEHAFLRPGETMENPAAICLQRGLFSPLIYAKTLPADTLRIVNQIYGSRLNISAGIVTAAGPYSRQYYSNRSWTEELVPSSPAEDAAWEEARQSAYQGSMTHFLRALIHGRLREEGFEILNPEAFRGLFQRENDFLLVAENQLRVRVAGDPEVKSLLLRRGFLIVTPSAAGISGNWGHTGGGNWGGTPVPASALGRIAEEQDSLWGRPTLSIDRVLSVE